MLALSVMRCLCVCHVRTFCQNEYSYPQTFFTVGRPIILVFPHKTGRQYSDGNPPPLTGAPNARGYKNHDFRLIFGFISKLMQDRAIVTMEGEYETAPKLSNGTSLNDLEWTLTQISKSRYYSMSNNWKTVQDRAIFFSVSGSQTILVFPYQTLWQ